MRNLIQDIQVFFPNIVRSCVYKMILDIDILHYICKYYTLYCNQQDPIL